MKTCIYLRKSRADRENQNLSDEQVLKRHREILIAYAKTHALDIVDIKEEVVSGESLARRPEMLKLLEEIEENKYDAVLVMDFDRLGRGSMMEQGLIINAFKESGTKIITPNKTYNLENDFDEDYLDLSALFARKELKMITKRLQRGRMKSLEEGNYISPWAPYGYDKDKKTLKINLAESDVIKLIFNLYINQGYGDTRIAKYLTENKIINKNGITEWDRTTIRKIIQNPVYIGKVSWNKREYKYKDDGKRTSKFLDKAEWKVFEGKHEPIIDEETFKKAQIISKERYLPHIHTKKELRNPLAYIMKCSECGATMTIRTSNGKKDTLRCYKHCGSTKSSYIYLVEERLLDEAESMLLKRIENFNYNQNHKEHTTNEQIIAKQNLEKAKKQYDKLLSRKEVIYSLYEDKKYDSKTFLERMNNNNNMIETCLANIEKYEKIISDISSRTLERKTLLPLYKNAIEFIRGSYWKLKPEKKNEFLKSIIKKVIYKKSLDAEPNGFTLEIVWKI